MSWPPPRPVRAVLAGVRRRYHRLPAEQRPALTSGSCYGMTAGEMLALARAGHYPLPPRAIAWLRRPPRRPRRERVADIVRAVVAAELSEAIACVGRR